MRKFLLLPLILCLSGPAQAELTDIRARLAGESGRIWLAFDQQPRDVVATPGDTGLVLEVHGVSDVARAIEPAHRDLVDAIRLVPDGSHLRIELSAARAWSNARAEIRQGGVLIEVGVSASTTPLARIRSGNEAPANVAAPAAAARPSSQAAPSAPPPAAPVITPPQAPQAPQIDVPAPAAPAAPEAPTAPTELASPPPAAEAEAAPQPAPEAPAVPALQAPDRCAAAATAVEDDPWNDTALMVHAGCLNAAGSRREAAGIYAQMLAFEPENTEAALALAEIHVAEGNRAEAAALYRQVASQSRSDAAAAAALQRARELEQ
ncbi:tetratricopeptide repeat protein [Maricaulis sp.]|uniref:tetratricopeptide repeat protein n=1 Tax=Maricaulis sp. TaxID=1486257 RepID=UPI0026241373|nr:tetratricopeptide repeat protein [Maricaulis sp.]